VLEINLPLLQGVVSAKTPRRLPAVLTEGEVGRLLARTDGAPDLMLSPIYTAACASWVACGCA
jgi:hypothetical protein